MKVKTYESEQTILNLFACVGLIATVYELIWRPAFSPPEKSIFLWIAAVVCFNSLHVVLTLANVWMIPEYKKIFVEHFRFGWKKQLALFLGIAFLFAMGSKPDGLAANWPIFRWPVIAAILILNMLHTQRQTVGMSLLLNTVHRNRLTPQEQLRFSLADRKSRKFEHAGVYLTILAAIPMAMPRVLRNLVEPQVLQPYTLALTIAITAAAFVCIAYSFWILRSKELIKHKLFFSFRYAVSMLSTMSFVGTCFRKALHGLEYVQLQQTTFQRSRIRKNLFWGYLSLCVFLCVAMEIFRFPEGQLGFETMEEGWGTKILALVGTTLTYTHYYIDSLLYRMKDPVVRQEILPLLIPPESAERHVQDHHQHESENKSRRSL